MNFPEVTLTVGPEGEKDHRINLTVFFSGQVFVAEQTISAQEVVSSADLDNLSRQVMGVLFANMGHALLNPPQS